MRTKFIILLVLLVGIIAFRIGMKPSEYEILISEAYKRKNTFPEDKVFDGTIEPNIPSSENDESLFGVDSNDNQIRDDIEIWINRSLKDRNERMAARQFAVDLNYNLQAAKADDTKLIAHAASVEFTTDQCLKFIFGLEKGNNVRDALIELSYNTKEREETLGNSMRHVYSYGFSVEGMYLGEAYKGCNFEIYNKEKLMRIYLKK